MRYMKQRDTLTSGRGDWPWGEAYWSRADPVANRFATLDLGAGEQHTVHTRLR